MKRLILLAVPLALAVSPAHSKGMKWMDGTAAGLPAGATFAVVKGDPSKAADFVIRAKFPANYTVPPHHHPTDEVVRVLGAGTLAYGMGDKVDASNAGSLVKGYHVTMQANMDHWVTTTDPLEIEVSGMGPFQIIYADPKDDPRGAK